MSRWRRPPYDRQVQVKAEGLCEVRVEHGYGTRWAWHISCTTPDGRRGAGSGGTTGTKREAMHAANNALVVWNRPGASKDW